MEEVKYLIPEESIDAIMNNVSVLREIENDLRDIFNQTGQGAKLTNQELAILKQRFIDIQNTARNTGKLGKTWFQTLREGMSSFSIGQVLLSW